MQFKPFFHSTGIALSALVLAFSLTACGGGSDEAAVTPPVVPPATLSAEEIAGLKYMREEEKLAHDVYVFLYGLYADESIFNNISNSETSHTEAILSLLVKYGIPDPAAGKLPGEFADPALQTLYNTLVAMGDDNKIEGLKVGALIEETDIRDINEKKSVTDEADILAVYDNLLCGSRNHLRAFDTRLKALGVTYVPTVISQAEWDAIANSPSETCGG